VRHECWWGGRGGGGCRGGEAGGGIGRHECMCEVGGGGRGGGSGGGFGAGRRVGGGGYGGGVCDGGRGATDGGGVGVSVGGQGRARVECDLDEGVVGKGSEEDGGHREVMVLCPHASGVNDKGGVLFFNESGVVF
jgi:hypothetical protein